MNTIYVFFGMLSNSGDCLSEKDSKEFFPQIKSILTKNKCIDVKLKYNQMDEAIWICLKRDIHLKNDFLQVQELASTLEKITDNITSINVYDTNNKLSVAFEGNIADYSTEDLEDFPDDELLSVQNESGLLSPIDLYNNSFLTTHDIDLKNKWSRIVILALVEPNEDLLTNRLYLLEVSDIKGNTSTFLQGVAGGGSFSECSFWNGRMINSVSSVIIEEDENVVGEFSAYDLEEDIIAQIEPYKCEIDEETDEYRFNSLDNFLEHEENDDFLVSYHVWLDSKNKHDLDFSDDRNRLKNMIKKSGLLLTNPLNWD